MYTYKVQHSINLIDNIIKMPMRHVEIDEYIDDNEILEEIIVEQLIEDLYYEGTDITITNIEPFEGYYTNKELNNCTEDDILC